MHKFYPNCACIINGINSCEDNCIIIAEQKEFELTTKWDGCVQLRLCNRIVDIVTGKVLFFFCPCYKHVRSIFCVILGKI